MKKRRKPYKKPIQPKTRETWKKAYLKLNKEFDELQSGYVKLHRLCQKLRDELMKERHQRPDWHKHRTALCDEYLAEMLYGNGVSRAPASAPEKSTLGWMPDCHHQYLPHIGT